MNSVAQVIKQRILAKGPDCLWNLGDFPDLSPQVVTKNLYRLYKQGLLIRINKGLYYYPKETVLGCTYPPPEQIGKKLLPKGYSSDYIAFYNLGLINQVPSKYSLISEKRTSIDNIKTTRRNVTHLKGAFEQEIWILNALMKINKISGCSPDVAIKKIISYIKKHKVSCDRLAKFALKESPRVRALVGAIGDEINLSSKMKDQLKKSLNPLTIFKLKVNEVLKHSKEWNID
ncbi:MAG: DUF6088 family protein [Pseudomonadota bacterium]